jgi:hypothetical protein
VPLPSPQVHLHLLQHLLRRIVPQGSGGHLTSQTRPLRR